MKVIQTSKNQLIRIIVISLSLIVLMILPLELLSESRSVCLHFTILRVRCPLCGMTRAVHQVMHLRFSSAIQYNAVVVLFPVYWLADVLSLFHAKNWLVWIRKAVFVLILFGLLVLYVFRIAIYFND